MQQECTYNVRVQTGAINGAGTDSIISLELRNRYGDGFTISNLEDWGLMAPGHDYFEAGNLDQFGGVHQCLRICSITVTSNGQGNNPGWFLDFVEVSVGFTIPFDQLFPVDQWLAIDEPPYTLSTERDLCPL